MARWMGWLAVALGVAAFAMAFGTTLRLLSWILLGGAALLGAAALILSSRRWTPTRGRDATAREAEARLWSTLNSNRR